MKKLIKKFTDEEYQNAKGLDLLTFECIQCGTDFKKEKRYYTSYLKGTHKGNIVFCSRKCEGDSKSNKTYKKCVQCGSMILRTPSQIGKSKTGNVFCTKSCAAIFNNKNKKVGTRRSKLEIWIEEELKKEYKFDIIFNGKEEINSELDIYIPSLKLAFELNGIFHYEPIYGEEKLKNVKNNDERKFQACLEKDIEFCTIDTSNSKKFKPERDKKYLKIIKSIIDNKLGPVG